MIVRIVKLSLQTDKIPAFLTYFDSIKQEIRLAKGNEFLALHQDLHNKSLFFTYSYWNSEADLELYRNSPFFKIVWPNLKKMFLDKPEAWTVNPIATLA